ncbi:hypothetical protein [Microseira wollei]|uniref:hypothetical protein n=1 Tax=Microseira wollei TaxID=467598 RepID=UPI001CFF2744|nr:hypothetical protein [Microseira wollei]
MNTDVIGWFNASKPNLFFHSQSYLFPPCQWDDWRQSDRLRHARRSQILFSDERSPKIKERSPPDLIHSQQTRHIQHFVLTIIFF